MLGSRLILIALWLDCLKRDEDIALSKKDNKRFALMEKTFKE